MLYDIRDGSKWVDGYAVAVPDKRSEGLYSLPVRVGKGDNSEIIRITLTKPQEGHKGPDRTKIAQYIKKGDRIIAAVTEVQKGEFTNYYPNQIAWTTSVPAKNE